MTQVLRATNGFMLLCKASQQLVAGATTAIGGTLSFSPVVFTTATLNLTGQPLRSADSLNGELPENTTFATVPWLWYEHNLSASLRAELPGRYYVPDARRDWEGYIRSAARRAVAIVNTEHIATFLHQIDNFTLEGPRLAT